MMCAGWESGKESVKAGEVVRKMYEAKEIVVCIT